MLPARQEFTRALASVTLERPIIPIHSNVTAHVYGSTKSIARLLVEQLYKPVRWEQTLHVLYSRPQGEDFPRTFEVGPGQQLGAVLRKVNEKAFEQYCAVGV